MIITRPFNSKDNEINLGQKSIIDNWATKNNESISSIEIYAASVKATTMSGRTIIASITEGCRSRYANVRNHFYLKEVISGKHKRIPKNEW